MTSITDIPTPNIPLLRKNVEWAEAEYAKGEALCEWFQGGWAASAAYAKEFLGKSPDCCACFCIAGHTAATLGEIDFVNHQVNIPGRGRELIWDAARDALGLTQEQADALFDANNTIEDVRRIAEEIAGERL